MNREAEAHLANAAVALAKGDKFYGKAADEIIAAKAADPALTNAGIGERFGHTEKWVRQLVGWRTGSATSPTPYSETGRPHQDRTATKKLLREAPIEEIERIVAELPKERRDKIERAIVETHPALQKRPPLGVGDSIKRMEGNTSFVILMAGSLAQLAHSVETVQDRWGRFEDNASAEEKEIVQEQIRDAVASLLAINSDPQELLR